MSDPSLPQPFKIDIPVEEVERMKQLIAHTRLPDQAPIPGASWDYGVDLKWLREMKDAWQHEFDWKDVEREMNAFDHYTVHIESVKLHFIHQRSARPDAIPLIFCNGWPSSFWEYHPLIESLTNPSAGQPAFHVVIPSLPGFTFSSAPPHKGWSMEDNARIFDHLMTGVLNYPSYMAQGGDFGGAICLFLGSDAYPACKLLNVTALPATPPFGALLTLPLFLLPTSWRQWAYGKIYTEAELADLARVKQYIKGGSGYFLEQATQPFSIGYALNDSPVGLLAWIGAKYVELLDPKNLRRATRYILATVSLYFLTGTFVTSTLPYYENTGTLSKKLCVSKPIGNSQYPYDVTNVPASWARKQHPGLVFARRHDEGGHFPAYEVPELIANDLREMAVAHSDLFA
ncbi:hypothetical protein EIP86_000743 [Pleurotus ostreatoroseus]|nr:hypothetical protein EIP86_000743 [Pleurotus ostreatoroseus]